MCTHGHQLQLLLALCATLPAVSYFVRISQHLPQFAVTFFQLFPLLHFTKNSVLLMLSYQVDELPCSPPHVPWVPTKRSHPKNLQDCLRMICASASRLLQVHRMSFPEIIWTKGPVSTCWILIYDDSLGLHVCQCMI